MSRFLDKYSLLTTEERTIAPNSKGVYESNTNRHIEMVVYKLTSSKPYMQMGLTSLHQSLFLLLIC